MLCVINNFEHSFRYRLDKDGFLSNSNRNILSWIQTSFCCKNVAATAISVSFRRDHRLSTLAKLLRGLLCFEINYEYSCLPNDSAFRTFTNRVLMLQSALPSRERNFATNSIKTERKLVESNGHLYIATLTPCCQTGQDPAGMNQSACLSRRSEVPRKSRGFPLISWVSSKYMLSGNHDSSS